MTSLKITSQLDPAQGAHPTVVSSLSVPALPSDSCSVYLYYTFPPLLFVDAHELALRSQQYTLVGLRGRGSRELEKPVHALPLDEGDVEVLVRLEDPTAPEVHLPIHVRYAAPAKTQDGYLTQEFEAPRALVWCQGDISGKSPSILSLSYV
ncbi:hypothetical protein CC1G_14478 [Coprinopsis cinerea okayama7|uniref:Protein PBN1 n=1 Tax=Coprinopsis cinerea (strain Okayama-7 / 130 / ATCC MYA-4618 / FGSC 9003) TaxID=240176 RepID=D6RMD3_COPC7|nr:hypothetical protein CC1G_14478 [Coprinopsis cinerea okayama7\|eukprot:XP_002911480.1 hypothetical protein CC1G_14478 [Coprinopsis cinerea okayama7\